MNDFAQGDIIKISGYKNKFLVVSKNAFIRATNAFHVCPMLEGCPDGPLHIRVTGKKKEEGTIICEQLKLIDPSVRNCSKIDSVSYDIIMNISDALQGIFEYD